MVFVSKMTRCIRAAVLVVLLAGLSSSACVPVDRAALDPNTAEGFILTDLLVNSTPGLSFTLTHEATRATAARNGALFFAGALVGGGIGMTKVFPSQGNILSANNTSVGATQAYDPVGSSADASDFFVVTDAGLIQYSSGNTLAPPDHNTVSQNISTRQTYEDLIRALVVVDASNNLQCYSLQTQSWNNGGALTAGSVFSVRTSQTTYETVYIPQDGSAIRTVDDALCANTTKFGTILSGSDMPISVAYPRGMFGNFGSTFIAANYGSPRLIECVSAVPSACSTTNMQDRTSELNLGVGDAVNAVAASETIVLVLVKKAAGDIMVYRREADQTSFTGITVASIGTQAPLGLWMVYTESAGVFYMSGGSNAINTELTVRSRDGITWVQ